MTKKEVAKMLRAELNKAIRSLPDDVNYVRVAKTQDETRDYEEVKYVPHGHIYIIQLEAETETERYKDDAHY